MRPFDTDLEDSLGYFLVTTEAVAKRSTVQSFIRWLQLQLAPMKVEDGTEARKA